MENSHTDFNENEGTASIDPTFSASFRESFKMDYFATADQELNNPRSSSFSVKETDSSTKKLEGILAGKGVIAVSPKAEQKIYFQKGGDPITNKETDENIASSEASDSDDSFDMKPRERNKQVIFAPANPQDRTSLPAEISRREKSMSYLEPNPQRNAGSNPRPFTESFSQNPERSMVTPKNTDVSKSVNINTNNMSFIEKSKWTEDLKCYVCSRVFNKMDMIFTHHCRICGRSVCGDCSTKKINNDRACDVCVYKANNMAGEETRRLMLAEKKRQIKSYKKQLEEAAQKLEAMNEKKKEVEKLLYDELGKQTAAANTLQIERNKIQESLQKTKGENEKLKESIEANKKFVEEKQVETQEMKEVLDMIKSELAQKQGNCKTKEEEVEELMNQKQVYRQSFYSCVEPDTQSENSFYRDPSFVGSCNPSLPGEDTKSKSKKTPSPNKRNF